MSAESNDKAKSEKLLTDVVINFDLIMEPRITSDLIVCNLNCSLLFDQAFVVILTMYFHLQVQSLLW